MLSDGTDDPFHQTEGGNISSKEDDKANFSVTGSVEH